MLSATPSEHDALRRVDGYASIGSYAPIGDGRAVALVSGRRDRLALRPRYRLAERVRRALDPDRGGDAVLRPSSPFSVERAYVDGTDVLATTFRSAVGTVRVADALELAPQGTPYVRTILRAVECVEGSLELDSACRGASRLRRHPPQPHGAARAGVRPRPGRGATLRVRRLRPAHGG